MNILKAKGIHETNGIWVFAHFGGDLNSIFDGFGVDKKTK